MHRPIGIAVVVVLSLVAPHARADMMPDDYHSRRFGLATRALAAINKRDVPGVKVLVRRYPLSANRLWFASPACTTQFGGPGRSVSEQQLPAFVRCLAALGMTSEGAHYVLTPGFIVRPVISGEAVIGFTGDTRDGTGTLDEAEAIKHLVKGSRQVIPDAATERRIEGARDAVAFAQLRACIGTRGQVEQVTVLGRERSSESYAAAVVAAVKAWRFSPFLHRKRAVKVCTQLRHVYPLEREGMATRSRLWIRTAEGVEDGEDGGEGDESDEAGVTGGVMGGDFGGGTMGPPPPPPPPPPTTQNVPPTLLEGQRLTGTKQIVPDAKTTAAIAAAGKDKLVGSWKLCLDTAGLVSSVRLLKSTGFPAYDGDIEREMRAWTYRPYQVNGTAVPVCTAVTFIYAQPASPQPAKP